MLEQVHGYWVPKTDAARIGALEIYKGYPNTDVKKVEASSAVCTQKRRALDIGAHIGLTALFLAETFEDVLAFEAAPETFEALRLNTQAADNIYLSQCIVSDTLGELQFEYVPDHTQLSHALLPGDAPKQPNSQITAPIEAITIDSLGLEHVDFIKLDVEGFETHVIRGAEETIKRCRPVIVMEQRGNENAMHGTEVNEASKLVESWGMVEVKGMPFKKDRVYRFND